MKQLNCAKISFVLVGVVIIGLLSLTSASLATEDKWTTKAPMPTARCTFSTGVVNERIYAIGGAKGRTDALRSVPLQIVEEYHPATDTWTRKADMPTARNALCVSVVDGRIYAIGGSDGIATPLDTVEEYNPETDTWTRKSDMPTVRYALSTSVVNGKIYAIGGSMGGFRALSTVEQYDPVTDTWTKKEDMPTARIHVSTSVVDGKIYAIGGVTGTSASASRAVEQYDPATDTWTRKANMPSAGCTLSTSVVNGKIYAIGGSSPMPALAPLSTVQEYNPVTDTWTNRADMPTARSGLSTSAVNGKIYAIGGLANPTGMALATVEEYDTGFVVLIADFNSDGVIDLNDLVIMIESWDTEDTLCDIAPPPDGDGIVDRLDLELFMTYWEQENFINVDEDDDGSQVTLKQGQRLVVTLESNPSTGYSWELVEKQNSILEQIGEVEYIAPEPTDPPMVGVPGWEVFRFEAVSTGQETLELVYRRPWETDVEPIKTFSIEVTVN